MLETTTVLCPYCGEGVEVILDPQETGGASGQGTMVQDCEVCCNPWQLTIYRDDEGELYATAEPAQ